MQRLVALILALFYLSTTCGIPLHLHYCMGELVDIAFTDNNNNNTHECGYCGMVKKPSNGCCKNECTIIKNEQDQQVTTATLQLAKPLTVAEPLHLPYSLSIPICFLQKNKPIPGYSPPGHGRCPIYLQVQNLRI